MDSEKKEEVARLQSDRVETHDTREERRRLGENKGKEEGDSRRRGTILRDSLLFSTSLTSCLEGCTGEGGLPVFYSSKTPSVQSKVLSTRTRVEQKVQVLKVHILTLAQVQVLTLVQEESVQSV